MSARNDEGRVLGTGAKGDPDYPSATGDQLTKDGRIRASEKKKLEADATPPAPEPVITQEESHE